MVPKPLPGVSEKASDQMRARDRRPALRGPRRRRAGLPYRVPPASCSSQQTPRLSSTRARPAAPQVRTQQDRARTQPHLAPRERIRRTGTASGTAMPCRSRHAVLTMTASGGAISPGVVRCPLPSETGRRPEGDHHALARGATGGHRPSMSVANHHTEENGPPAGTPTIFTSRTPSDVQNAAAVATPLTVRQKAKERPCHPRAH